MVLQDKNIGEKLLERTKQERDRQ
jgi:hypothetical protein